MTEAPDTEKPQELMKKVLKRAEMIRTRWQDIPAPPEPKLVHDEPDEDAGAEEDEESREAA